MAITKSAQKELRKNLRRRKENLAYQRKMRELKKKILSLVEEKKVKEAQTLLPQYYKVVDKAAKTKVIKENTARRRKARLAALLNPSKKNSKENH
jgi:small subunit ribosomal protein S20